MLRGSPPPKGVQDGVLTANDVSTVLLPNTHLVVLSACNTGRGEDRTSEGVYGLQRAFQSVGVDHILMSLEEVDDRATAAFMKRFYTYILEGQGYHASFRKTQQDMIRSGQFSHPRYWAAFILLN